MYDRIGSPHRLVRAWLLVPLLAAPAAIGQEYSGEWSIPQLSYNCAFGNVQYLVNEIIIQDNNPNVTVTLGPSFPAGQLTGTFTSATTFQASLTVPGTCTEIYVLNVSFTGPVSFTGTLQAGFDGDPISCFDCFDQQYFVGGTKPSISNYGTATPGCGGSPGISAISTPQIGNQAFAITGDNAPADGQGLIVLGNGRLDTPLAIFSLLVWVDPQSSLLASAPVPSDAQGETTVPLPIPNNPALIGLDLFAQFAWLDACGASGLSASRGLEIILH